MAMKIFVKPTTDKQVFEYGVHPEHECDMHNFLIEHTNKIQNIGESVFPDNNNIHWFGIKLTQEDIDFIKETTWYHNTEWSNPTLGEQIIEGGEIEVICLTSTPIIKKD